MLDENSNYRSVLGGLLSETTGTRYHKITHASVDYAISEGFKGVLNYFEQIPDDRTKSLYVPLQAIMTCSMRAVHLIVF